jgi:hypothetical protein
MLQEALEKLPLIVKKDMNLSTLMAGVFAPLPEKKKGPATTTEKAAAP